MKHSVMFSSILRTLEEQCFIPIKEYLDTHKQHVVFQDDKTLMSFYPDCTMVEIRKELVERVTSKYILITKDKEGLERVFEIDDWGCVVITDLIFILEQIEADSVNPVKVYEGGQDSTF